MPGKDEQKQSCPEGGQGTGSPGRVALFSLGTHTLKGGQEAQGSQPSLGGMPVCVHVGSHGQRLCSRQLSTINRTSSSNGVRSKRGFNYL